MSRIVSINKAKGIKERAMEICVQFTFDSEQVNYIKRISIIKTIKNGRS